MDKNNNNNNINKIIQSKLSKNYFNLKGRKAEKFVHDLAFKTFLTDWCYPNPLLPNGKELCDLLVIFDNVAIVWQIKNLKINSQGKYKKSELKKNLRQINGARRQLFDLETEIELENPRRGKEKFDPNKIEEIYLISVILGESKEGFNFIEIVKNQTIHVFTKNFIQIILNELDTISDFCGYLRKKESFIEINDKLDIIINGGEEELLAYFLFKNRSFTQLEKADEIFIEDGIWEELQNKPEFKTKKEQNEISYYWDSIIDRAHESNSLEYEKIARELARPDRFERRCLSKVFAEAQVIAHNHDHEHPFRRVFPSKGVTYCFLFKDDPDPRTTRKSMLGVLCYVARGIIRENKKVIGIATEKKIRPICTYDFCLLKKEYWSQKDQQNIARIQEETGLLVKPTLKIFDEEEYPEKNSI